MGLAIRILEGDDRAKNENGNGYGYENENGWIREKYGIVVGRAVRCLGIAYKGGDEEIRKWVDTEMG